ERELQKVESRSKDFTEVNRQYLNMQREYKLLNDLYTYLLNKRSEAGIAQASSISKASVLEEASPYRTVFVGPKESSVYTTNLLVGLIIPLGIIALFYFFNARIIDKS